MEGIGRIEAVARGEILEAALGPMPGATTTERVARLVERLAGIAERFYAAKGEPIEGRHRQKLREEILAWIVEGMTKATSR